MHLKDSWLGLTLVVGLHVGGIYLLVRAPSPEADQVVMPTIQGVLLPAPPAEAVQQPSAKVAPPPKKPDVVKQPKPNVPPPKPRPAPKPTPEPPPAEAPPSARAITRETAPTPPEAPPPSPKVATSDRDNNHTGAPVTPPRHDANPLNNPAPAYPSISRRLREQGIVELLVLILPDGSVGDIKVKTSSGFERLDKTAVAAVRRWKYLPAMQGNTPIPYWYVQPLEFSLN